MCVCVFATNHKQIISNDDPESYLFFFPTETKHMDVRRERMAWLGRWPLSRDLAEKEQLPRKSRREAAGPGQLVPEASVALSGASCLASTCKRWWGSRPLLSPRIL